MTPAPNGNGNGDPVLKEIADALKNLNARLEALEKAGGGRPLNKGIEKEEPPLPKGKNGDSAVSALAIFNSKCSKCHLQGRQKDGGDFVLLTDQKTIAPLDARKLLNVSRRTYNGSMPPKNSGIPALTDEEVGAVMAFIDTRKLP